MIVGQSKKETTKNKINRALKIMVRLKKLYPESTTALQHKSALQLLISTILSAQCTDERVNTVTPDLFKKYKSVNDFAKANQTELEQIIRSTGFYHAKARNIINCCRMLVEKYDGIVPDSMEKLIQLPGVGRKTANVVLGNYFNKIEGIVVDTHVKRLSGRLRFSANEDPEKIECDLMDIIKKKDWIAVGNLLIFHGRRICPARNPKCKECTLNDLCPSAKEYMK